MVPKKMGGNKFLKGEARSVKALKGSGSINLRHSSEQVVLWEMRMQKKHMNAHRGSLWTLFNRWKRR